MPNSETRLNNDADNENMCIANGVQCMIHIKQGVSTEWNGKKKRAKEKRFGQHQSQKERGEKKITNVKAINIPRIYFGVHTTVTNQHCNTQ